MEFAAWVIRRPRVHSISSCRFRLTPRITRIHTLSWGKLTVTFIRKISPDGARLASTIHSSTWTIDRTRKTGEISCPACNSIPAVTIRRTWTIRVLKWKILNVKIYSNFENTYSSSPKREFSHWSLSRRAVDCSSFMSHVALKRKEFVVVNKCIYLGILVQYLIINIGYSDTYQSLGNNCKMIRKTNSSFSWTN